MSNTELLWVKKAFNPSNNIFRTGTELSLEDRERLPAGSEVLDDLLSGGLATGAITQVYGASATGKTHFCHLFSVALP